MDRYFGKNIQVHYNGAVCITYPWMNSKMVCKWPCTVERCLRKHDLFLSAYSGNGTSFCQEIRPDSGIHGFRCVYDFNDCTLAMDGPGNCKPGTGFKQLLVNGSCINYCGQLRPFYVRYDTRNCSFIVNDTYY